LALAMYGVMEMVMVKAMARAMAMAMVLEMAGEVVLVKVIEQAKNKEYGNMVIRKKSRYNIW